ncbi:MAG TPA: alpha/beta hydrolase family protein [Pseudonocardiaceae bacterium]|nr:alpha/beta hydrolase family protein [Pseudonocardiaceae bacterium]
MLSGALLLGAAVLPVLPTAPSAAAAGLSSLATADDGASVTGQSTVDSRMVDVQVSSPALGFTAPVRLILPKDYAAEPTATWPVLYLLDGCCDAQDYKSWTAYTNVESFMADKDVLVVLPSDGAAGLYSDWWNFGLSAKPGWETFHTVELEQLLQRDYRAGTVQAVAGISIGGYGAMAYAARHPGLFRAAASYSGVLDTVLPVITQVVQGILVREQLDPLALWGDVFAQLGLWSAHNPFDLATALRGTTLFVSSGNGSPGPLDAAGASGDALESAALVASQAFTAKLALLGVPVTTDYYGNGTHSWPYWQREFEDSWPMLATALGVPAT